MHKGYDNEIGKARVLDVVTSIHKGYLYDMPVSRHILKSYTTFTRTPLIMNISNDRIK